MEHTITDIASVHSLKKQTVEFVYEFDNCGQYRGLKTLERDNAIIESHGLDIRFRMLKNHELKKAQGFPDDYVITGNTTEQTKQIGNAVPVNTAKALALAIMGA
jgi:site-specific DNA-cytosine methylase